ncbi:MAG: LysR family transcriptional regulator [Alphaproteobacteria bacterium]|nr:LysR family transcriptional regulator [Alphaproteobacteria bacterium]
MTPLAELDLNLLVALDALLAERSVTRAARRLGLSQPAMSNALARLRRSFDDPLLVRGRSGMVPTPRALALAAPVREALGTLEAALESLGQFDPGRARRVFRIAANEPARLLLLPGLLERICGQAPGVGVRVSPLGPGLREALEQGRVDLALGSFVGAPPGHVLVPLMPLPWVSLGVSPAPQDPEEWAAARHLALGGPDPVDEALQALGLERRVAVRLPGLAGAASLLRSTGLILTLAEPLGRRLAEEGGLTVSPVPLELPLTHLGMLWHARHSHDPAQAWLRQCLAESLGLEPPPLCGAQKESSCLTDV